MKMPSTVVPSLFLTFPLTITIPRLRSPSGRMREEGRGGRERRGEGRGGGGGGGGGGGRGRGGGRELEKRNERKKDIKRDKESGEYNYNRGELRPARLIVRI